MRFDRNSGIGASEAALALGLAPLSWGTPYDLYLRKTGQAPAVEQTRQMDWGNRLEEAVAQWYTDTTGNYLLLCSTMRHAEHEWLFATPDRVVTAREHHRLVQIKTVDKDAFRNGGWGRPGTDEIPDYYKVQVQIEQAVFGVGVTDVPVLVGGNEALLYTVEANPLEQTNLIAGLRRFWQHVIDSDPPDPKTLTEARQQFPLPQSLSRVEATEQCLEWLRTLHRLQNDEKVNEKAIDALKAQIAAFMGEAETLVSPLGAPLATWKVVKREGYTVPPSSSRQFRLK